MDAQVGSHVYPDRVASHRVESPLLGNLYLHHVLDRWFEDEIVPRLQGTAEVIRYCDDFVIGFQLQEDAERVMEVLGKRLAKYGLSLQLEKTRLIPFERPPETQTKGKGPGTFDFLGFRWYWRRARSGTWVLASKTRPVRLAKSLRVLYLWCRRFRHKPLPEQHAALRARIQGHINYFGDTLWMSGWALVTLAWWPWLLPVVSTSMFVFMFIPQLTKHLREKYGAQFEEWEGRTKRLVPFVY